MKAGGKRAAYLHSMGRALRVRNMRTPTRPAEPKRQRAKGGKGTRPKASGNRAAYLHSMGRASRARNMRTNN